MKNQKGKLGKKTTIHISAPVDVKKRFIAYIIDWFLSDLMMAFPVIMIYSKVLNTTEMKIDLFLIPAPYDLLAGGLAILCAIIYFVGFPLYHHGGQTPGKRFCKFKITMENDEPVHLKALILRQIIGIFLIEGSLMTASKYIRETLMILTGSFELMQALYYIGIFFGIISILLVVVTKKRKAIHDILAKTKVVSCDEQ